MKPEPSKTASRQGQPAISQSIRVAIVFCALAFPVIFWMLVNASNARAAWAEFARIIPFSTAGEGRGIDELQLSDASLDEVRPQQQAELLLQAAIEDSASAASEVATRAPQWRGRVASTPRVKVLVGAALNSPDLDVRAAGIEVELCVNNLADDPASADRLIDRIHSDPAARPWGLWMLGALGSRGVESGRVLSVLTAYTHDSAEQTRYWAVEGLSLLGQEQSIPPLLSALHGDSSQSVRERAASALARSGMLTKQQRLLAVPALIEDVSEPALSPNTQTLAYKALHDITGADVEDTPSAWHAYWADSAAR